MKSDLQFSDVVVIPSGDQFSLEKILGDPEFPFGEEVSQVLILHELLQQRVGYLVGYLGENFQHLAVFSSTVAQVNGVWTIA